MPNEWEFVADCATQITLLCSKRSDLPFERASVESQSKGFAQRRDLTLWNREGEKVLTGEVRLPDHPQATHGEMVRDAQQKADEAGAEYYFTWNVNSCILWRTFERGKSVTERDIEKLTSLPAPIATRKELESPRIKTQVNIFLERLLDRCAALLSGAQPLPSMPLDEKFLAFWEATLDRPIAQTFNSLNTRYDADGKANKQFTTQLDDWMKAKQGWQISHKDETVIRQNLESAAKFSCYVLANKIIFYKALRRKWTKLKALQVPESVQTGAHLAKTFGDFFADAQKMTGDYETVFEGDFGDALPFLDDAAVVAWRLLCRETDKFDFTNLDFEVIGQIFERMLSPNERHKYGQHFTRSEIVDLINAFCIRDANTSVLDPACGGGTFLVRAYARKRALSGSKLSHQELLGALHGIDVSAYPAHLTTVNLATRDLIDSANYPLIVRSDFFDVQPGQMVFHAGLGAKGGQLAAREMPKLGAIVGNPPYIKQEAISDYYGDAYKARLRAQASAEAPGVKWSGRSDIHCYFWAHSLGFLEDDGWLGLLVSSTWLDTDYGFRLQGWMMDHFEIRAIFEASREKWFEGARIKTTAVILRRQNDATKRAANKVRFCLLTKKIEELMVFAGDEAARFAWFDDLRDRVETFDGNEELELPCGNGRVALRQGVLDGMRIRVVTQADLRRLGENAPAATIEDLAAGETPDEEDKAEAEASADEVFELSASDYKGFKWGLFLRAPDVFFGLLKRAHGAFVPLHQVADVKFGIKSGCDKFFFPKDVTEACLKKYVDPHKFKDQFGITRAETKTIRLVEAAKQIKPIEAKYLESEIHSMMELSSVSLPQRLTRQILILDKAKKDLKNTHVLDFIRWGEREGFHERRTCAARNLWYDLTGTRKPNLIFPKLQQYRHFACLNPNALGCSSALLDVSPNDDIDLEALGAVLNSTIVALFKWFFGRQHGTEGSLQMDVYAAKLMLVPDPRKATPVITARLRAALKQLGERQALPMVDVDATDDGLSGELALADRQELDDATLELLGISDPQERLQWRDALYNEMTHLLRDIREMERDMQKSRNKTSGLKKLTLDALAQEILDSAQIEGEELKWRTPLEFLPNDAPCDLLWVPVGRPEKRDSNLFEDDAVHISGETIQTGSPLRSRWVEALAISGLSGELRVPTQDELLESALRDWEDAVADLEAQLQEWAANYNADAIKQKKLVAELKRRIYNNALQASNENA